MEASKYALQVLSKFAALAHSANIVRIGVTHRSHTAVTARSRRNGSPNTRYSTDGHTTVHGAHHCYRPKGTDERSRRTLSGLDPLNFRPERVVSNAPLSGFAFPQEIEVNTTVVVAMNVSDADVWISQSGDELTDLLRITFVTVPALGELRFVSDEEPSQLLSSGSVCGIETIFYSPPVSRGGRDLTSFSYYVTDGLEQSATIEVGISVRAPRGYYLHEVTGVAKPCAPGLCICVNNCPLCKRANARTLTHAHTLQVPSHAKKATGPRAVFARLILTSPFPARAPVSRAVAPSSQLLPEQHNASRVMFARSQSAAI